MSPGGRNEASWGSNTGPPAGSAAAASMSGGSASGVPARSQVRRDSWSSHSPVTLRRNRIVPSTPPSLVKFACRLASVRIGAAVSTPTSDHVPDEM